MNETAVIDYMDDPSLAVDDAWRIEATNSAFEDLLGGVELRG